MKEKDENSIQRAALIIGIIAFLLGLSNLIYDLISIL